MTRVWIWNIDFIATCGKGPAVADHNALQSPTPRRPVPPLRIGKKKKMGALRTALEKGRSWLWLMHHEEPASHNTAPGVACCKAFNHAEFSLLRLSRASPLPAVSVSSQSAPGNTGPLTTAGRRTPPCGAFFFLRKEKKRRGSEEPRLSETGRSNAGRSMDVARNPAILLTLRAGWHRPWSNLPLAGPGAIARPRHST